MNGRLDSLLRAVSAARGLATASTATAPSPQVSVNDYLQRALPTLRGRHHPGVEQRQRQPSHTISLRTPTIGGGSGWPIGGNQTIQTSKVSRLILLQTAKIRSCNNADPDFISSFFSFSFSFILFKFSTYNLWF